MTRVVRGSDGRMWTLHGVMEWRTPATADDFEHDVSAGHVPGVVMLVLVLVLSVVLISWTPVDVYVPLWFTLLLVLVMMFFPLRWALRRPWTLVAETGDDGEGAAVERWVGTVRGVLTVRQQVTRVCRNIEHEALPGFEGPLHPVD